MHATFAREHEYKCHGTVTLLADIDGVTGKVHALVKDRHRSREFIEFLKLLRDLYTFECHVCGHLEVRGVLVTPLPELPQPK